MILEGGFGPEDVVALTNVLESIWTETKGDRLLNGLEQSAERERLASIIIALSRHRASETADAFRSRVRYAFFGRSQISEDAVE
jgi:hypothetical protein